VICLTKYFSQSIDLHAGPDCLSAVRTIHQKINRVHASRDQRDLLRDTAK
jgi:hypothetical protein